MYNTGMPTPLWDWAWTWIWADSWLSGEHRMGVAEVEEREVCRHGEKLFTEHSLLSLEL